MLMLMLWARRCRCFDSWYYVGSSPHGRALWWRRRRECARSIADLASWHASLVVLDRLCESATRRRAAVSRGALDALEDLRVEPVVERLDRRQLVL